MNNYYYLDDTVRRSLGGQSPGSGQNGPLFYQSNVASYRPYLMPTPTKNNNYYYYINPAGLANPYYGGYVTNQLNKPADYYDGTYGGRRNGTKIAAAIVVVLLVMAVTTAIGLGVYFGVYAGKDTTTTMSTTATTSTTITGQPTTQPIPTIPVGGLLTLLDELFTEALNDETSNAFNNLESEFCENMNSIYQDTSLNLVDCVVHNFIDGSVKVNYTLFFENAENSEEPVYIQDIQKNASSALINGIKEGTGSLNIGEEDVEFNDDGDDCEVAGCEHNCTDSYFSFTCSCYAGFNLSDDGKACAGVAVHLSGVVVLNETYADALTDPTSAAYQSKETDVCSQMAKVFDSGYFVVVYTGCVVNNFLQGSIVVNLTLSFKVSSLIDKVEFLEDVEEEIEAELENNNIFSDTSVVYYDFDNDIPWCYNNPSVCGNTGCDGIQCVCEEDKIYHGPSDCRDSIAFRLLPPYADIPTVYLSTEVVPDSSFNYTYHVIVCIVRTNHTDELGGRLRPIWLDPEGNPVPFYPYAQDRNGITINDFSYKEVLLHNGTWTLDGFYNSHVRALAFSEPDSSDSGTYTCHAEGRPRIATFVNIEFVECETDLHFACAGQKQCIPRAQLCDRKLDCLDTAYTPNFLDEFFCDCTEESFNCSNGAQCVAPEFHCDAYGNVECEDGSDQKNCTCSEDTYSCTSEDRCIPFDWLCDGSQDCPDGDDENDSACSTACDRDTEYLCGNSTMCISKTKLCDGYTNCPGGDDEADCVTDCGVDETPCPSLEHVCISSDHICDGIPDCPNGADEWRNLCVCEGFTCGLNGSCISNSSVCDGWCDCDEDCSDELGCNCTTGFVCNNTQCLPWTEEIAFCDKEIDCLDGSDEPENCSCTSNQFDCGDKCLPMEKVCDSNYDCDPADQLSIDELNCNCTSELFACDNGKCVNPASVCNLKDNCGDFSDERNCSYCDTDNGWHVCEGHGMCIPGRFICDGISQCFNGFDELNCTGCIQDTFECVKNGEDQCLPLKWICDGATDCDNGQDELNCDNCTEFSCNDYSQCFNFSQQCDGTQDCADGSDEWQCLRIDEDSGVLKYFDGASQELIPVCGNLWDVNNNQDICDKLGKGISLGHEVVSNSGEDDKYRIYGDTPHTGSVADCGAEIAVKVMCEEIECGKRSDSLAAGFIINGEASTVGEWPWQVALFASGRFICGGTLVHPYWVVTAAHCVYPPDNIVVSVRLGSTLRQGYDVNALEIPVAKTISHPDYDDTKLFSDIAMLKLAHKAVYSDFIRPACLPEQRESPDSTSTCYSTGFGAINKVNRRLESQIGSDVLLKVKLSISSAQECNTKLGREFFIPSMLCAGYTKGFKGTCSGDSGGPLVCLNQFNTWDLVGVTSWGIVDGYTGIFCTGYNGFADVAMFVNWIKQQMQTP